ncbi:sensor histidine kinase RcsC [Lachnospiraceae bacterium]|jgi:signal transduction histidine kinase/CheY-like chemotaxis protein|nr:sensor histidine kinase RcsC [Lachnospiraceae bacterium]
MDKMKKRNYRIVPVLLVFCILGGFVISVARSISMEMSESAILNLGESLNLIKGTVETLYKREADYQKLVAREMAAMEEPENFVRSYESDKTIAKILFIRTGNTKGISNTGESFSEDELDFSGGFSVEGLPISTSYVNDLGTWAYTMKCPVEQDGGEIGTLYMEYIYDSFEEALPEKLYNGSASLYIMDTDSQRFVLKPKGIGERDAGHLNLRDFYQANNILEKDLQDEISESIRMGKNVMFYHDIQGKEALIYMWAVNGKAAYLIGFVPVEAIQQEGNAVNRNMFMVVFVMLAAFFLCVTVYFLNERQRVKIRREREAERETHSRQLAEALQAAQAANHSKTMFLSNMSHDIRTPMNAILGFATLLAKDADNPEKVREYTKKIDASGHHLLSLINDVLDVSKIESGKVVLTIGEFTLGTIVSSVDAIIRPAARARNQSFHVSVTGIKHENLIGDETRLNQILINLLSNAVKYTQEGGDIWFRILGLGQRSSQFEHIRIEVEDNGFGMTPDYLKVIFDAFTRAENSTTNKVQGTGLGMAITKNIVELMGGTIEVASEEGKGSKFTVELELRIPERQIDGQFWEENGISHVLAVDDDEELCSNMKSLLESAGVRTDVAYSGEEAVALAEKAIASEDAYQMILMDWNMPGMGGKEAVRQIRRIAPDGVWIFILTANDLDAIEGEAPSVGIDAFLSKPFFATALKEKLLELKSKESEQGPELEDEDAEGFFGLHVLVAEDNDINAEILIELLSLEGVNCEVAENGKLALERFVESAVGEFDVILMDVQMPVMNGYEATKAIRALPRKDAVTIPIIAMTANAFAEDVRDALNAGMNAHVAKPIEMDVVKETISQYLNRK